eukprot:SAG25_NODE_8922_length_397_cov_0.520134_2_plen_30_part_01
MPLCAILLNFSATWGYILALSAPALCYGSW